MYVAYDENINVGLKNYFPFMKAVAGQFENQCEVVMHDFKDYNRSVLAMFGNVTGRELYSPLTNFVIEIINKEGDEAKDRIGYITHFKGRPFKCSTTFIRDGKKVIGCICINYCVQEYFALKKIVDQFTTNTNKIDSNHEVKDEYFANNIDDLVEHIIQQVIEAKGEDLSKLTKEERIELVRELEEKGVFLVKGTVETLAERMNMSKYTIYNYIEEVRK